MASLDLNDAVRSIVADQVAEALAPYQSALNAISALTGLRRGPGRPKGFSPKRAKRGLPAKRSSRASGDASKFSNGQAVRYKQGRGEFDAKIVKIDTEANRVTIERTNDGKKVVRPADKVYAA